MDEKSAAEVLSALADGVDPTTGAILPSDNPCQHPTVIRALFTAIEALKGRDRNRDRRRSLPEKTGAPWTAQEDADLIKAFEAGKSIPEIAASMQRTRGGIEARLIRLGKPVPEHDGKGKWWPGRLPEGE